MVDTKQTILTYKNHNYTIGQLALKYNRMLNLLHCYDGKTFKYFDSETGEYFETNALKSSIEEIEKIFLVNNITTELIYKECAPIRARYQKVNRINKYLREFIECDKYSFITLTFNDDVLSSTSEETRRRYVRRFLLSLSPYFIANIDFGKENEREHYHAIIRENPQDFAVKFDNSNYYLPNWTYGFSNVKKYNSNNKTIDKYRLSRYLTKFSFHALKNSTKNHALIYSVKLPLLFRCSESIDKGQERGA